MGYRARQTSDARGYRPIGDGIFISELVARPLGQASRDVWSLSVPLEKAALGDLLHWGQYSLLAHHLVDHEHVLATTRVRHGSKGGVIEICVNGKRYRSQKSYIYSRDESEESS